MGLLNRFMKRNKKTEIYQRNYEEQGNDSHDSHESHDLSDDNEISIDMGSKGLVNTSKEDKSLYYSELLTRITDNDKMDITNIAKTSRSINDIFRRMEEMDIPLEYLVAMELVEEIDIESYQNAKAKGLDLKEMVGEDDLVHTDDGLKMQVQSHMQSVPTLKNALSDEELGIGEPKDERDIYQKAMDEMGNQGRQTEITQQQSEITQEDKEDEDEPIDGISNSMIKKATEDWNDLISFDEDTDPGEKLHDFVEEFPEVPVFEENNPPSFNHDTSFEDNMDFTEEDTAYFDEEDQEKDEIEEFEEDETDYYSNGSVEEETNTDMEEREETEEENEETENEMDQENTKGEEDGEEEIEVAGEDIADKFSALRKITNKLKQPKEKKDLSAETEYTFAEEQDNFNEGENVLNQFIEDDDEIETEEEIEEETTNEDIEDPFMYKDDFEYEEPEEEEPEPRQVYVIAEELLFPIIDGYEIHQVKDMTQITQFTSNRKNLMVITQKIPKDIQKSFLQWLKGVEEGSAKYRIVSLKGSAVSHGLVETLIDLDKESLDMYFEEFQDDRYAGKDVGSFLDISSFLD